MTSTPPPSGSLLRLVPENKFNGAVALSYDFPSSPFALALTWCRVHTDKDDSASGFIGITEAPANYEYDFAANATSSLDYDNDIVTLALGATFYPHCAVKLTPQLGVTYLRIKDDQTTTYSGNTVTAGTIVTIEQDSSFKGFGPSLGFDLDYLIYNNFSLFGKFLYSALAGDIDASYSASQSGTTVESTNVNIDSNHQILSLIQTELGLAYHFMCVDYKSEISVGYAFAKIFGGAENNAYFSDDVSDSLFITNTTDLGFQGPFIRFFVNFDL